MPISKSTTHIPAVITANDVAEALTDEKDFALEVLKALAANGTDFVNTSWFAVNAPEVLPWLKEVSSIIQTGPLLINSDTRALLKEAMDIIVIQRECHAETVCHGGVYSTDPEDAVARQELRGMDYWLEAANRELERPQLQTDEVAT